MPTTPPVDCSTHHDALRALLPGLPRRPHRDPVAFHAAAADAAGRLDAAITEPLRGFAAGRGDDGFLLLRGLPVDDDLPDTPGSQADTDRPLLAMEAWTAVVGAVLGRPIGFAELKEGRILQDVFPLRTAESLSSESSQVLLDLHTELAYHRDQPRFLLLGCERPDHDARASTLVASVRRAVPSVAREHRAELLDRPVPSLVDVSFRHLGPADGVVDVEVLSGDPSDPLLRLDTELLQPDERSRPALEALVASLRTHAEGVVLQRGDLVVLDNHRTCHARTPFSPRFDGIDRWLHRMYVASGDPGELVVGGPRFRSPMRVTTPRAE